MCTFAFDNVVIIFNVIYFMGIIQGFYHTHGFQIKPDAPITDYKSADFSLRLDKED